MRVWLDIIATVAGIAMSAPIIAYQLSLLGDEPKPCHAWRRAYFVLTICGERFMSDEEKRQHIMLRPDSLASESSVAAVPAPGATR